MMKLVKIIIAQFFNVPFEVKGFWPYSHRDFEEEMSALGIEIGEIGINPAKGKEICFLRNVKYDFRYVIKDIERLRGSDFLEGTDQEFDLEFVRAIKRK